MSKVYNGSTSQDLNNHLRKIGSSKFLFLSMLTCLILTVVSILLVGERLLTVFLFISIFIFAIAEDWHRIIKKPNQTTKDKITKGIYNLLITAGLINIIWLLESIVEWTLYIIAPL
jgi:hypothetical protein